MGGRRRGRGEGSIVQRADGRWMARVDLGWRNGKRERKTLYAKTRREAADALGRAQRTAADGSLRSDERQTVGQFLSLWLEDVAKPRVRPRTWNTYEAAIRRHVAPYLGPRRLSKLTPQHCQAWLTNLAGDGVPVSRRRYARVVLRTALATALKWQLVTQNVAALVEGPRAVAKEIRPLGPPEALKLITAAKGGPLHAFVTVALGCGLRLGESLGLRWQDVDLDAGTLSVRYALQRIGGNPGVRIPLLNERRRLLKEIKKAKNGEASDELVQALAKVRLELKRIKTTATLVEPKSTRSRRTIALPAVVLDALKSHQKRQLEARLAAGSEWQENGFVFSSPIGTPIDGRNLTRAFKALLVAAELPPVRIHDLRHSCATLLLAQGVSPRVVMETLGHSQISLTMNTYSHVLPDLQRESAERMNRVLSG